MGRIARIVTLGSLVLLHAAHAVAQTSTRATIGIVSQGGIFGDDGPLSTSHAGATLGIETRRAPGETAGLAFDLTVPIRTTLNPHFDERIRPIYLLVGGEFGGRTFARLLGGAAIGVWSGTQTESFFSLLPAAGFAFGHHIAAGTRLHITPELVAKGSVGHGVATWMMGVQVAIGRR